MPLVWAHAEFLKLMVARSEGRPLERLDAVWSRWKGKRPRARNWHWRDSVPFDELPSGGTILVESDRPFTLHFGHDGWQEVRDEQSQPVGLDVQAVRLPAATLRGLGSLEFTRRFDDGWEGRDWQLTRRR